jgi:hypothetical protein
MPWLLNPGLIVDPVISGFYDAVTIWKEAKHSNVFGLCPLSIHKINEINLEINAPKKGINRQIQSIFAKDMDRHEYIILHRGRFHRRSRDSFDNWYKGKTIEVDDGGSKERLFYITNLNRPETLVAEITYFLNEVIKFKNAVPLKR